MNTPKHILLISSLAPLSNLLLSVEGKKAISFFILVGKYDSCLAWRKGRLIT